MNIQILDDKKDEKQRVKAKCFCGTIFYPNIYNLKSGNTKSCGCLRREKMRQEAKKRFTGKKPANFKDYTGKKIGLITVIKRVEDTREWTTTYLCKCECGTEFETEISSLRRAKYDYCNHIMPNHPIRKILYAMKDRCENTNSIDYKWYGGKGIKVCEEWKKFPHKFIDWGLQNDWEEGLTIDRIDSAKDYCPENCQWITRRANSQKAALERWGHEPLLKKLSKAKEFLKDYGYEVTDP